jgi:hypothetical protein
MILITLVVLPKSDLDVQQTLSEAGLMNRGSCVARALGVTKFMNKRDMILVTLVVLLKSDLDVQQTLSEAGLLNRGSCIARALGVTKFVNKRDMILVTLVVLLKSDLDVQQTLLWPPDASLFNIQVGHKCDKKSHF